MIFLMGDIHGDVFTLGRKTAELANRLDVHLDDVHLVQLGDFGWNPTMARPDWDPRLPFQTYFLDGNHEYHDLLPIDAKDKVELKPNLWYLPRGTFHTINGIRVAVLGGAASVDEFIRKERGWHHSATERITPSQRDRLLGNPAPDVFLTHTPPQQVIQRHFDQSILQTYFGLPSTWADESAEYVDELWTNWRMPPLYCGHMHRAVQDGTCRILDINEITIHHKDS